MPEPPVGRAADGEGNKEFAELRRLLIGQDLDQIAGLQKRLDDPLMRSAETGKVLPAAIKAASGKNLRAALEPVFEKSFQNSVRKHPREISDAIYPVMGPAIRTSIAAAIREFAESLNQIVEKSASWRAIRWRVEARAGDFWARNHCDFVPPPGHAFSPWYSRSGDEGPADEEASKSCFGQRWQ